MASFQWAYNSHFLSRMSEAVANKRTLAFILSRIDDIGIIRDHYGLVSCDAALITIEEYLKAQFRDRSMRRGDEFYILVFDEDPYVIAEFIRIAVPKLSPLHKDAEITMNFGVYKVPTEPSGNLRLMTDGVALLNELRHHADHVVQTGQRKLNANRVY